MDYCNMFGGMQAEFVSFLINNSTYFYFEIFSTLLPKKNPKLGANELICKIPSSILEIKVIPKIHDT